MPLPTICEYATPCMCGTYTPTQSSRTAIKDFGRVSCSSYPFLFGSTATLSSAISSPPRIIHRHRRTPSAAMNNLAIATVLCIIAVCSFSGVEGNLMCYNCTYTKVLGFEVGEMGCKSPFVSAGISEVSCDGSCVKRELKGDIPTTMRTCHTLLEGDCVDLTNFEISAGNTISQDCCTTNLCNGAGALAFSLFVVVTALCGALAVNH